MRGGDMETIITYNEVRSLPGGVYFAAAHREHPITPFETINYQEVIVNIGNGIDGETGVFTAPVDGSYQFSFYAVITADSNGGYVSMWVYKNGEHNLHFTQATEASQAFNQLSPTWQMLLKKGDQIHLKLHKGVITEIQSPQHPTFIGELITEQV